MTKTGKKLHYGIGGAPFVYCLGLIAPERMRTLHVSIRAPRPRGAHVCKRCVAVESQFRHLNR